MTETYTDMRSPVNPLKVLVVGAGITGCLTSSLLQRTLNGKVYVEVWDKSRGVGGRMSTSRFSQESPLSVDLGAQYISVTPTYWEKHRSIYEELLAKQILAPLQNKIEGMRNEDDGTKHFIAPNGINSLPKYFLNDSGSTLRCETLLDGINVSADHLQVSAKCHSEELKGDADIVILTMPVPQVLRLSGHMTSLLLPFKKHFESITYSSRYALGLFYNDETGFPDVDWCGKYVKDNSCIRYVSIDTAKRQTDPKDGVSVVAHASVPFSVKHIDESFDHVEPIMFENLQKVIPGLSEPSKTKLQRWRYSQVLKPYGGETSCFVLNNKPLLMCAGDGFGHSNFDGCIESALSIVETISNRLESEEHNRILNIP